MLMQGIIIKRKEIKLEENEIIPFILKFINENEEEKEKYNAFLKCQLCVTDFNAVEYAVSFMEWVIVYKSRIYYCEGNTDVDKVEYLICGFKLEKKSKLIIENGRVKSYLSAIQKEIEKIGLEHSQSEENELSFWYPKITNIGFKTPETIITSFNEEELAYIKRAEFEKMNLESLTNRVKENAIKNNFDLNRDNFIKLSIRSNKFNFTTCHLRYIEDLPNKLLAIFDNMYDAFEWAQKMDLVLREFIKTNYYRQQIYNGLPLNTEFRVFYDFDKQELLGIFNYWEKDTMLDNLYSKNDIFAFANTTASLERDFKTLSPILEKEVQEKLPQVDLKGKWSIDFLYDGEKFVLIDMGHAECSYYYDKVLERKLNFKIIIKNI